MMLPSDIALIEDADFKKWVEVLTCHTHIPYKIISHDTSSTSIIFHRSIHHAYSYDTQYIIHTTRTRPHTHTLARARTGCFICGV